MEAIIWKRFDCPYILPFYGVCTDEFESQMALVAQWMDNGTTLAYLKAHPDADCVKLVSEVNSVAQLI